MEFGKRSQMASIWYDWRDGEEIKDAEGLRRQMGNG